jgi:hypothetical protein
MINPKSDAYVDWQYSFLCCHWSQSGLTQDALYRIEADHE